MRFPGGEACRACNGGARGSQKVTAGVSGRARRVPRRYKRIFWYRLFCKCARYSTALASGQVRWIAISWAMAHSGRRGSTGLNSKHWHVGRPLDLE